MKRLLILSGKGGTGKTTAAAAFISFSKTRAAADFDVDAPNLHIVIIPRGEPEEKIFIGSKRAEIDAARCTRCGKCREKCRFDAISTADGGYSVIPYKCEGCGLCEYVCPEKAVTMLDDAAGKQLLYKAERVFSTAELNTGRGNSGKLVTAVKLAMLENAPETQLSVSDGSPGIGCPVIASVSGADLVLIAAEPSETGISDLKRLIKTAEILGARTAVFVNKWDLSPEYTQAAEAFCAENGIPFTGKVPYDKTVGEAVNAGKSIASFDCPARKALYEVYNNTMEVLK